MAVLSPTTVSVPDDGTSPIGSTEWNGTVGLIRKRLDADTTFYVRTDGSDSNNGEANTSGGAWRSPQGAFNYIVRNLDLQGYTLTVQCGDGTYTAASGVGVLEALDNWVGGGRLTFKGNTSDRTAVKFSASGSFAYAVTTDWSGNNDVIGSAVKSDLGITDIQLLSANGTAVAHGGIGDLYITNCDVSASINHFTATLFARLFVLGTYTILSGGQYHIQANDESYIGYFPTAVNTTSSRAFSVAFVGCQLNSFIDYFPVAISGSGVTGKKYIVTLNATLNAISTAISSFPGTTTGTNERGLIQHSGGVWHGCPDGTGFHDDAENEQLLFAKTSGAVNYWEMTNSSANTGPLLAVKGDSSNIPMRFAVKGAMSAASAIQDNAMQVNLGDAIQPTAIFYSTGAGAFAAPCIALMNDSASPAAGDFLGAVEWWGRTGTGVREIYGGIWGRIIDPSTGTGIDGLTVHFGTVNGSPYVVDATVGNGVVIGGTYDTVRPGVGNLRSLGYMQPYATSVAGLPSASSSNIGARAMATDATTNAFAATAVGGSTYIVPVYSDGALWKIG